MNKLALETEYSELEWDIVETGEAVIAYLGWIKGCETVAEAVEDAKIFRIALGAMIEGGNGLISRDDLDATTFRNYIVSHLDQICDLQTRISDCVGHPLAKLSATGCLVGPMMNALDYGFPVDNLIRGIGAALHDCHEGDEQSLELQKKIDEQGVMETARELTGIGNQRILARIVRAYATIEEEIR